MNNTLCKVCGHSIELLGASIHRCADRQWVASFDAKVISRSMRLQSVAAMLEEKKAELRSSGLLPDVPWSAT